MDNTKDKEEEAEVPNEYVEGKKGKISDRDATLASAGLTQMFILTAASDRQGVAEAMVGITERNRRINNRQKSTDELWNRDGVRTAGEDDIDFDTHAGISAKCNECKKVSNSKV